MARKTECANTLSVVTSRPYGRFLLIADFASRELLLVFTLNVLAHSIGNLSLNKFWVQINSHT